MMSPFLVGIFPPPGLACFGDGRFTFSALGIFEG
jgi:hypothetical protein